MPCEEVLAHLTGLYAASDDPWQHRTSAYEAAKYAATLDIIGPGPFDQALEIGCGNGTLAALLAPRCGHLTLMECIPAAMASARMALAPQSNVTFIEGQAPAALPPLRPDLVLLSEVLYFLTPEEIGDLGEWLRRHASGRIIAVNWTGPTDEQLDGNAAIDLLAGILGQPATHRHDGFRIDIFDMTG
ncbi:SAM-dependent methyltransferase [Paracoccus sp. 1_MG-2023]|uniref:SAM-dependent methyltransferase n=1 Tax=unclassified Paracoccus (in: a-proteobacteria) TaxID=2688777 RepID=UPI001C08F7CB|nr:MULTISPECIES: SAM-dependent methyltransferase [unclassified Paracoccus (in: a-proteobacteria)]MBU2957626.1 nodulation S family protein [Paracoccus sp. C2R09]MDO6667527.1 SAM-dependent methyltransferase [Paracoccus sp. 1_MG-2023]